MPDQSQISIRLAPELARQLKAAAALDGRTISEVLRAAAEEYISARDCGQAREFREGLAALAEREGAL